MVVAAAGERARASLARADPQVEAAAVGAQVWAMEEAAVQGGEEGPTGQTCRSMLRSSQAAEPACSCTWWSYLRRTSKRTSRYSSTSNTRSCCTGSRPCLQTQAHRLWDAACSASLDDLCRTAATQESSRAYDCLQHR